MTARFSSEVVPDRLNFNDEYLRIFAFTTMVIDHVAFLYEPENFVARGVGRLALPIFLYLLIKGWKRTRSVPGYFLKLLQWGIISQVVIYLLNIPTPNNILLMMAYCLIMLECCQRWGWQCLGLFCVGADFLNLEYGYYGVIICYVMQFRLNQKFNILWISTHLLAIILGFPKIQLLAILAPEFIKRIESSPEIKVLSRVVIKIPRLFWYISYPVQWIVLAAVKSL